MNTQKPNGELQPATAMAPVILRLQHSGLCSPNLAQRLEGLSARMETAAPGAVLQVEKGPAKRPRYLLSGWACRSRHLDDGRRQILSLVLPGEGVGVCLRRTPFASATTTALTPVKLADAAPLLRADVQAAHEELVPALNAQADLDESRAMDQIVRLGQLNAIERLAHFFLELRDRLAIIGQVEGDRFPLPLTQEALADAMGLSVVHINRTLQELRRQGLAHLERGFISMPKRETMVKIARYEQI